MSKLRVAVSVRDACVELSWAHAAQVLIHVVSISATEKLGSEGRRDVHRMRVASVRVCDCDQRQLRVAVRVRQTQIMLEWAYIRQPHVPSQPVVTAQEVNKREGHIPMRVVMVVTAREVAMLEVL